MLQLLVVQDALAEQAPEEVPGAAHEPVLIRALVQNLGDELAQPELRLVAQQDFP